MKIRRVPLFYDKEQDRWCADIDGCSYGLHCGEVFRLHIGKQGFDCRLEMDTSWYIITEGGRFTLREHQRYLVSL
ncbi:DUF5348 domain-containing protein [Kyrpidia spormannii]|uniref:Uncharacterized protein n=2 Tax=Kyrpidia spormannii TaxID=2055160 RepID=A0ACA8Z6T0_9BACL|nr:DUF5348 domain-containing protein [Kyrpidia spormannii]CAB3389573.1 conserved protein of unknown function [Kyrpidia spormannii]CAB3390438.1 conserved protein of unknown function [Kyrpidia spormannii]